MQRTAVDSSNLHSVGYDPNSQILEVAFLNGRIYQYENVPQEVYQNLMNAPSHGSYFHHHIRTTYRYYRIR